MIIVILLLSVIAFSLLQLIYGLIIKWKGYRWFYRNIYLNSPHWKVVRWLKFHQVGRKCRMCRGVHFKLPLDVHHKTYKHVWWEMFYLNDLQVLCRYHHILLHRIGHD